MLSALVLVSGLRRCRGLEGGLGFRPRVLKPSGGSAGWGRQTISFPLGQLPLPAPLLRLVIIKSQWKVVSLDGRRLSALLSRGTNHISYSGRKEEDGRYLSSFVQMFSEVQFLPRLLQL